MLSHWRLLLWPVLAFAVFFLFRFVVFDIYVVRGQSMSPTLPQGTLVLILRSPFFSALSAGNIVMVENNHERIVKRILALGPAHVEWNDRVIRVNGRDAYPITPGQPVPLPGNTFVDKNMVFLSGDNPQESIDSRSFGPRPINSILGRVIFVFHPFW